MEADYAAPEPDLLYSRLMLQMPPAAPKSSLNDPNQKKTRPNPVTMRHTEVAKTRCASSKNSR